MIMRTEQARRNSAWMADLPAIIAKAEAEALPDPPPSPEPKPHPPAILTDAQEAHWTAIFWAIFPTFRSRSEPIFHCTSCGHVCRSLEAIRAHSTTGHLDHFAPQSVRLS